MSHGARWVPHEWLTEAGMAAAYRVGGYWAVSGLRAAGVVVLIAMLSVQCFRRTTPYRAVVLTALAIAATSAGWGERPQLFSFVLLAAVAPVLLRASRSDRTPWWLVPLSWLWASLHGYWTLGVLLAVVAAVGAFADAPRANARRAGRLGWLAVGMLAAAAATANGPRLLLAPFEIAKTASLINEYRPPSLHSLPVLLVPLAATRFPARRRDGETESPWLANAAIATAVVVSVVVACVGEVRRSDGIAATEPRAATAVIRALPGPRHVLVDYGLGGWLLWAAPDASPAIDGRTEIYDAAYVRRYFAAEELRGDWRALVAETGADSALLRRELPLVVGLRDVLHWHEAYADPDYVVLVAPSG
ncbi:MAG: hypothetical protein LC640_12070 [Frankia sp.]|nr:hypothetical protein [Frankia sp.]